MNIILTPISDLVIIEPRVFSDDRGWFFESYNVDVFAQQGITTAFVQDNHSSSVRGVLRGVHFQHAPKPMAKLVRCSRGRLWDVAVDLRTKSPTFKQWFGIELSAENKKMLYIPAGFGHGFYALEDCELVYKCSATYDSTLDAGVSWNDPELAIQWPLIPDLPVLLSSKDQQMPSLKELSLSF